MYDSDSSSLSEGEIVDEKPKKKQKSTKRSSKKYGVSDDSSDSSNESDSMSKNHDTSPQGKTYYILCFTVFKYLP